MRSVSVKTGLRCCCDQPRLSSTWYAAPVLGVMTVLESSTDRSARRSSRTHRKLAGSYLHGVQRHQQRGAITGHSSALPHVLLSSPP